MKINTDTGLKHYAFPSIGQFAELVASVNRKCTYIGRDENNDPIYDMTLPKPTLKFVGTTKLHGTNAGVVIDFHNDIVYYESRENIITSESDNAGFANYMVGIQDQFVETINNYLCSKEIDWINNVLVIYGEWCGGSIQKGVALNGMDKMFVIFSATIRTRENTESRNLIWFPIEEIKKLKLTDKKVYNIYDFKTWEIEIDFSKFHEQTNKIIEWTNQVEDMCPFAKELGVEGVGEGIVFRCITESYNNSDFWFKSKGAKHAKSKVKTLKPVDDEKINRLMAIAEDVCKNWRLEQMFHQVFNTINGGVVNRQKIGDYIKSVSEDVQKEETLTLEAEGISYKEIAKYVSKIATDYFFMMEKEMLTNPQ